MLTLSNRIGSHTMLQIVPSSVGFSPTSSSDYYHSKYSSNNLDPKFLHTSTDLMNSVSVGNTNGIQPFLSLYHDQDLPPDATFSGYDNPTKNSFDFHSRSQLYKDIPFFKFQDIFSSKYHNNNIAWALKETINNFRQKPFTKDEEVNKNSCFLDLEMTSDCHWDDMRTQSNVCNVLSSNQPVTSSICSSSTCQIGPSTSSNIQKLIHIEQTNLLEENKVTNEERKPAELLRSILKRSPLNETNIRKPNDEANRNNKLLKDTNFEKKYKIKPVEIGGFGTAVQCEVKHENPSKTFSREVVCDINLNEGIIAPVLSKAIEQLMQDIHNTCIMLGIPREPKKWSMEDVRSWLLWNSKQYNLPIPMELFSIAGDVLTSLNEQDFLQRSPQCGNILFAQLEIWKVTGMEDGCLSANTVLEDIYTTTPTPAVQVSDRDEDDGMMTDVSSRDSPGLQSTLKNTGRTSSSLTHLWQFLKELLSSPQIHGSCIRWVDRAKGVFKIEDSVRVAHLWGKRKNRPAMNYDKLSRSIRQYYKKGIMKKTERSQRLVYQFCTPYNL